jgi:hypothetical protein
MPTANNCRLFRALKGLMIEQCFHHQSSGSYPDLLSGWQQKCNGHIEFRL